MCAALVAASLAASAHAQVTDKEQPTAQLRALVESGRAAQAYERFCRAELDFPQRDLWCGIALVDIGRAGEAAIALERYVLTNPDDARGRLELARAYYHAGDDVRARTEFEAVQAMKHPADVLVGINRYLDALFQRDHCIDGARCCMSNPGLATTATSTAVWRKPISPAVTGSVSRARHRHREADGFGFAAIGAVNQSTVAQDSLLDLRCARKFFKAEKRLQPAGLSASAGASYERGANIFALSALRRSANWW